MFGQQLLQADHFASAEVEERLEGMAGAREDLEKAWIARRMQLDQCLELQLFYRSVDGRDRMYRYRSQTPKRWADY